MPGRRALATALMVGFITATLAAGCGKGDVLTEADKLLNAGQAAQAEALLQEAITRQGPGVEALLRLGTAQTLQSKYADSEATLRAALELAPGEPRLLHNLGLLFLRQERYDDALQCFQQALAARNWNPESNFFIGWIQERRGDREEAIRSYVAELNVNPTNGLAWKQYRALAGTESPAKEQGFPWDMLAIWLVVLTLAGTLYWLKRNYWGPKPSVGFREETEGPELVTDAQKQPGE